MPEITEDSLIVLLNLAWGLVEPKPKYDDCNIRFPVPDKNMRLLLYLEEENPILGLAVFQSFEEKKKCGDFKDPNGLSWLSLLATITDGLCGRRLAAIIEDDGTISGWQFYAYKENRVVPKIEQKLICGKQSAFAYYHVCYQSGKSKEFVCEEHLKQVKMVASVLGTSIVIEIDTEHVCKQLLSQNRPK